MNHRKNLALAIVSSALIALLSPPAHATDYEVGPGAGMLASIGEVPWESLGAGDRVLIHWRATPYAEKWVLCRRGTAAAPIVISGVPGPAGQLPVIDGRDAVTRTQLDYWNQSRGVLKIGGANTPPDTLPGHIVIENLEIRSGRPPYSFTNSDDDAEAYVNNAAAIYVEKAEHLVIRNCVLHDSGNGLFIGAYDGATQDILIDGNRIYDNGIEGRYYEHNTYTAAIHITYQYNRFGRLRDNCGGNNLKDRSAGLVVRYNWIEAGNRQLDLVETDYDHILNDPSYDETFVYGNILIEPDGAGNSQILHFGGDGGDTSYYRHGNLYFYHNSVVSTRGGNTTLLRCATNDVNVDVRNNVLMNTAEGFRFAITSGLGQIELKDNWLPIGWSDTHESVLEGTISDRGNLEGYDPGFEDFGGQDFRPGSGSPCRDASGPAAAGAAAYPVKRQYVRHRTSVERPADGALDIGALDR